MTKRQLIATVAFIAIIFVAWAKTYVAASDHVVLTCTPDPIAQTCAYTP